MTRYIGLDVHKASCTLAVVNEQGKRMGSAVVETNGRSLVEFVKTVPSPRYLCFEEGTQSSWLHEVLSRHVNDILVTHKFERTSGQKNDLSDALEMANSARLGTVTPVYKDGGKLGKLRAQADVHRQVTADVVRIRNRIKALYRSRGVQTAGSAVYTQKWRCDYIEQLPPEYQPSMMLLYDQLDGLLQVQKSAEKQLVKESAKHPISTILLTCPGLGPIRVAQLIPIIVSPQRFRIKRQLWNYCGLGVVMRGSSDWIKGADGWQRDAVNRTRGLNRNWGRRLKHIFKGAATTVIMGKDGPMYQSYLNALEQGTKPPIAKVTLARRIAATMLAMWKTQEVYKPRRRLMEG